MKLELRNVAVGYDARHQILEDVTFSVDSGQICCLLGANGVGKTTLFKTILQFIPALDGEIRIDGDDIRRWPPSKLAQYMAYVAQAHVPPFPYLVKDVVLLGRVSSTRYFGKPQKADYDIVDQALEDLGIQDLKERIYTELSGGERQLVMIARAMAQQPEFLVLDEPTASLDYGNTVRILHQVKRLADLGYGVIMTTHNPDHAFLCRARVALLQRSQPVICGSAVDVITEKNLHQAYGVDVDVKEFINRNNELVRCCMPVV